MPRYQRHGIDKLAPAAPADRSASQHACPSLRHAVEMAKPIEPLVSALNQADSLPFLFVGSGISIRYLGHQSWRGLLEWAAALTDRPYQYYAGQAGGDFPKTASLIAANFYETWWTARVYKKSRDEWGEQCTNVLSPLKIEVARRLSATKRIRDKGLRAELKLLGSCQVDGIITTNYDDLLERTFDNYSVFVGQEDLLLRRSYQLAEIYKIHGSIDQPDSLVLGAEDYEKFDASSPYLVAKLMSVFVEHPIVFLGYSLTDRNVRVVLTSLLRSLSPTKLEEFKSRFIWVDWDPRITKPIVGDHVIDLGQARLLPVLRVRTPSLTPVLEVLNGLERVLPVGVLRRVAESVVEIVHSADPTRQIRVADLRDLDNVSDLDIVIGVGENPSSAVGPKGYLGYNRHDLIVDTLTDRGGYDPAEIVRTTLPGLLRQTPNAWVPVRKYVRRSGIPESELTASIRAAMKRIPTGNYNVPTRADEIGLRDLVSQHGLAKALNLVCSLPHESVDVGELHSVLVEQLEELGGGDANLGTSFGKATVLYDILKYGPETLQANASTSAPGRKAARARSTVGKPPASTTGRQEAPARVVRAWANGEGIEVAARGRLPADVLQKFRDAHP